MMNFKTATLIADAISAVFYAKMAFENYRVLSADQYLILSTNCGMVRDLFNMFKDDLDDYEEIEEHVRNLYPHLHAAEYDSNRVDLYSMGKHIHPIHDYAYKVLEDNRGS